MSAEFWLVFLADHREPEAYPNVECIVRRAMGAYFLERRKLSGRELPRFENSRNIEMRASTDQDLGIPLGRAKRSNLHEGNSWDAAAVESPSHDRQRPIPEIPSCH
jgi:hypothetical protein